MSEDAQERTEEATPKRKQELKQKGNVLRSKELGSMLNLLGAGVGLMVVGSMMIESFQSLIKTLYTLDRNTFFNDNSLMQIAEYSLGMLLQILWPFLLIIVFFLLLGPSMLGGWAFSGEQIRPKLERMNPIKGLGKMVSLKGLVELIKSILKVSLVVGVSSLFMWLFFDDFIEISTMPLNEGMAESLWWVIILFFGVSSCMILITAIDVPFQIFEFTKQSKMTKQQVKDEFKETEGRPEVKSKIQQLQREMARRRMMDAVSEADVVITNPTHYAVALKYNENMRAPQLVAKGLDLIADKIREKATEHDVPIVSMPPLARALYFSTELEEEVPHGLYKAVAKVLAYIYQLRMYRKGKTSKPKMPENIDIPKEYRR